MNLFLLVSLLHFRDHSGGNEKIKQLVPGIKVYGGSIDKVKGCTDAVENGDKITLGADVVILSLHTPWYIIFLFKDYSILRETVSCYDPSESCRFFLD